MGLLDKFVLTSTPAVEQPRGTISEVLGGGSRNVEQFSVSGRDVGKSRDLARVLELPRRPAPTREELDALKAGLVAAHGRPNDACVCHSKFGRKCAKSPLDTQARALTEIKQYGGLLGPISVGDGKTLIDLLAAMVIPDCKVAVLLIPPQLRDQMLNSDWEFYSQHWNLPNRGDGTWHERGRPTLHIIAYSELSSAKNSDVLELIKPDLIIADEAHLLRNSNTARTKRFRRFLSKHPTCRFCCWSGTLTTKSIKDYAHLSEFALKEGSPAPLHWPTVEEWAGAIDPSDWPTGIGELAAFCAPGEHVREGYRRRLEDTGGVVSSPATMSCPASLNFSERSVVAPKPIFDALTTLYAKWQRPDEEELITGLDVFRCAKELSSGFYYRWRWPRNEPSEVRARWLMVRKEWHSEQREKLKQSKEFMDSPLLLTKAAIRWHDGYAHIERDQNGKELRRVKVPPNTKSGPLPVWDSLVWPDWLAVRDTAEPATEAVWVDYFLARDAAEWCKSNVGICWYEHDVFGRMVASLAGVPFCGPGEAAGAALRVETGKRSVVASIRAHGTGKNLQMFSRNLFANLPSDAAVWEQALGRTHRQGQEADEVTVQIYRHTQTFMDAFNKAKMLAQYIQETMGGSQKLLRATYVGF